MRHLKMRSINSNKVPFYPSLINDYISGKLKSKGIINWDYSEDQILFNAENRTYDVLERQFLVEKIKQQYKTNDFSAEEQTSLQLLLEQKTFTITTGHQLNLLGGSQFFYSKILDVVKLCKKISASSEYHFVPVFWMATEDHDYEEISSVHLFNSRLSCPGKNAGPVGRIGSDFFADFIEEVKVVLGDDDSLQEVKSHIEKAFSLNSNLADITRFLVRKFFRKEGLLIIDGDDQELKHKLIPAFKKELLEGTAFKTVTQQIQKINDYKIQVNPRKINLFYIQDRFRERIVQSETGFSTTNGKYQWTQKEILDELEADPNNFSPNVLLRPLYQEVLLPNVAYVGGAGEISYWLELQPMFEAFNVDFPIPIVRTSYFFQPKRNAEWLVNNKVELEDLFDNQDQFINEFVKNQSDSKISFDQEKHDLTVFYAKLLEKSKSVDQSMTNVVLGEEKRAMSSLQNLEKRFVNAEKKKFEQQVTKYQSIREKLFPGGSPMERVDSFIPLIYKYRGEFPSESKLFSGEIIFLTY